MAQRNGRKIFVNLPVRDLEGSKDYPDGHHGEVLWMDPAAIREPADAGAPA